MLTVLVTIVMLVFLCDSTEMEEGDSSDGSTSSVTDDVPNDIASPDPEQDPAVPASSETFFPDDRSQTPLQDEVGGADEQVADVTGSVQEVSISPKLHQSPQQDTTTVDSSKRCDDEVLTQTVRDDHGEELDYDEDVQPDGCPAVTTNASSPSNARQKAAADEEGKESGEEKVDNCFCSLLRSTNLTG